MILTVTANPAFDVTYRLPALRPGDVQRVQSVTRREGGKGVNVARVLHLLGENVTALGLGDGTFGAELRAVGIAADFLDVSERVRSTLVIHDDEHGTTGLWEPGTPVHAEAATLLLARVADLLTDARALVVSGSLPPGVPDTLPADLAALATDAGIPVVVDVDDAPLRAVLARGGAVLTPNEDELERLASGAGEPLADRARALAARNGAPVVLTRGAEGLTAATATEAWTLAPPRAVHGNATGAGDATAAGIALGLARGEDWPTVLHRAACLGAAAVLSPIAGDIDLPAFDAMNALAPDITHHT